MSLFTTAEARWLARLAAIRVVNVDFTAAEFDALKEQIDQALGQSIEFDAIATEADSDTGTVAVTLVTARTDHAAYFASRFGPRVRTVVVSDRIECWRANRQF